jgi:hypothetical protein
MTNTYFDIVAAFVDGERVDAQTLKAALVHAEARDYLAELLALREIIAQTGPSPTVVGARPSRRWLVAAAAAVVLSLGGGYALGLRLGSVQVDRGSVTETAAPKPTRIIEVAPGTSNVSQGGR